MKSITKPGKSGIYHQKQKKNSITGFQKRQPGLSPPIFGFQWLQRRTLFLYHRLAHPIWQRLTRADRDGTQRSIKPRVPKSLRRQFYILMHGSFSTTMPYSALRLSLSGCLLHHFPLPLFAIRSPCSNILIQE